MIWIFQSTCVILELLKLKKKTVWNFRSLTTKRWSHLYAIPLAPDPIRVQSCVWCLLWTNRNSIAVTSILLSISLYNLSYKSFVNRNIYLYWNYGVMQLLPIIGFSWYLNHCQYFQHVKVSFIDLVLTKYNRWQQINRPSIHDVTSVKYYKENEMLSNWLTCFPRSIKIETKEYIKLHLFYCKISKLFYNYHYHW